MLSLLKQKNTLSHEFLFGHIDNVNPAIYLGHALSNWVNVDQSWFHSFDILAVAELESLAALRDRDIRIVTATTKAPYEWAPGFETAEYITATLLSWLDAGFLVAAVDVLKSGGGVHWRLVDWT